MTFRCKASLNTTLNIKKINKSSAVWGLNHRDPKKKKKQRRRRKEGGRGEGEMTTGTFST